MEADGDSYESKAKQASPQMSKEAHDEEAKGTSTLRERSSCRLILFNYRGDGKSASSNRPDRPGPSSRRSVSLLLVCECISPLLTTIKAKLCRMNRSGTTICYRPSLGRAPEGAMVFLGYIRENDPEHVAIIVNKVGFNTYRRK